MNVTWIRDADALARMCSDLVRLDEFAMDLESDGMFRYRPRLCVLQIAAEDKIWLVDTLLAPIAGTPMTQLLGSKGPRKIIHDVSFDARILRENGAELGNVRDTALMARYLGEKQHGLAGLLSARFDVKLKKENQQADWGLRPLLEEAEAYLVDDVRFLPPLARALEKEVAEKGIGEEIEVELAYALEGALAPVLEVPPWTRLKGVHELPPEAQAVARNVANLRESFAREADVPPGRVLPNDAVVEIAKRKPQNRQQLLSIRGVSSHHARRLARAILEAIHDAIAIGAVPEEEANLVRHAAPPPELRAIWRTREKALTTWRASTAQERKVDPQVVLPGHCLQDLAHRGATTRDDLAAIAGLGEVRMRKYGQKLLEILNRPRS